MLAGGRDAGGQRFATEVVRRLVRWGGSRGDPVSNATRVTTLSGSDEAVLLGVERFCHGVDLVEEVVARVGSLVEQGFDGGLAVRTDGDSVSDTFVDERKKVKGQSSPDYFGFVDVSLDYAREPSFNRSGVVRRGLKVEASKIWNHSQDRQRTKIQLRANALLRKITAWEKINGLYIPGVDALSRTEEQSAATQKKPITPYTQTLWLPSKVHVKLVFDRHLAEVEWKLRIAQACEALDALRSNLQIRSHLYKFKDCFVRGQHANTRARNSIETVQARIQAAAEEYRAAYVALESLSILLGNATDLGELNLENWRLTLLPLEAGDIRELAEADNERTSEGRRVVSWIWRSLGVLNDNNDSETLRDALRIEWCKSRSRAMRFSEEVELLTEEMHRVLRYLTYKEAWWRSKAVYASDNTLAPICQEGLVAYASRQASLCSQLHKSFSHSWQKVPMTLTSLYSQLSDHANRPFTPPSELVRVSNT
ncbi:hypothetical protein H0H92_013247 [Tricholoma furcatifolium]|nr:hypothetical protein H0H92_013247 [Tricholoma furcatifolium]